MNNRQVVSDGLSLNGTSLHKLRYGKSIHKVRTILNVENWSRYPLLDAQTDTHCGEITPIYPAPNVYPGYREVMVAASSRVFSGTCGTISWQVIGLSVRLVVMWSVPYNLNLHDTYIGIAMVYNSGVFKTSKFWFNKMYYSDQGPHSRGLGGRVLMYENSHLVIYGYIESWTYHPLLNISVVPQRHSNLAPSVVSRLYREVAEGKAASVTAGAEKEMSGPAIVFILIINVLLIAVVL
ncbi:tereporin-Ts1 isoform X2 [Eurytemora carolleeae]|nr:tereporin-Ts1 isoform X2 [Eurytemora carolleeae]|eukprot:XP_023336358.1 tereporin-Ts1-like isoform X2 [Eurytemora affinis]